MHFIKNTVLACGIFVTVFGILLYVVLRNWALLFGEKSLWKDYKVVHKQIDGKIYKLVVAENPQQFSQGLMFVRKPVDFDGMIFLFPRSRPQLFWNMNTLVDLKIYWIDHETIVGMSNMSSIEKSKTIVTVSSPKPADTVVEIIQ